MNIDIPQVAAITGKSAFRKPSDEELALRAARLIESQKRIQEVKEAAVKCIESPQFKDYVKTLDAAAPAYVDTFLSFSETCRTDAEYLSACRRLSAEIEAHSFLLTEVAKRAGMSSSEAKES